MKIYFRVFELTIFSSLVNFTSVYERINKCSDNLHAYGKYMKAQEIFHLSASVKTKQSLKDERKHKVLETEIDKVLSEKYNSQINNKNIKYYQN